MQQQPASSASQIRQYKEELIAQVFGVHAMTAAVAGAATPSLLDAIPAESNIVGVGYGAKVTSGAGIFDGPAVRVYVRAKMPESAIATASIIPATVNGLPTDVVPVGDIIANARPTLCGLSVGHFAITAGTLGCLVSRRGVAMQDRFILSNNHVLANSNSAVIGDHVLEPGPLDGGAAYPPIADLTDFEPLDFSGVDNYMDAAIAKLRNPADVLPDIAGGIARVAAPIMPAALYQSVRKHGRTTLHTIGVVMDLAAAIKVRYGTSIAQFDDQLAINGVGGAFSNGGDSGSLIVDAVTRRAVGLLFAGGAGTTFANPIDIVLNHFNVDII